MEWLVSALVSFVLTLLVGLIAYWRLKNVMWNTINEFGQQFVTELGEGFKEWITPTVKKGFSMAGSLGGEAKAVKELQTRMAKGYIDNNYGELKMLAEQIIGIDVDEMMDQYGAPTVLKAVGGLMKTVQGKGGFLSGFGSRQKQGNNSSGVPEM